MKRWPFPALRKEKSKHCLTVSFLPGFLNLRLKEAHFGVKSDGELYKAERLTIMRRTTCKWFFLTADS